MVMVMIVVVVVHVDGRVRLLVVRRKGEGGLVWVDVLCGELRAVVARQPVVPLVVFQRPDAEESGYAEEEAIVIGCWG
jgi:hypothetical protein